MPPVDSDDSQPVEWEEVDVTWHDRDGLRITLAKSMGLPPEVVEEMSGEQKAKEAEAAHLQGRHGKD